MQAIFSDSLLKELAVTYGTPLYVYSGDKIEEQYHRLQTAFDTSTTRFFYACKALTNQHILKIILHVGGGIDCSSINEAHMAVKAGFPPDRILYTSNGIAFEEIEEAVKRNPNIIRQGRIQKIRRRIRRNAKGRIVVQKNRRRSAIKGYRIAGNTVKRIPAYTRIRKARLLKRSWKTTRRAKLRRSLLKRKLSMRRRASMGLR